MRTLTNLGEIFPWSAFIGAMRTVSTLQQATKGAGLRILTETVSSPTLAAQIEAILARFPAAVWHQWDPASDMNLAAGLRMAAGTRRLGALQRRARGGHRLARRRFLELWRRPSPLRATVFGAPAAGRRRLPVVRGRDDAVDYRREGRSSPSIEAEPDRVARARAGRRSRRRRRQSRRFAASRSPGLARSGSKRSERESRSRASSWPAKASRRSCMPSRTR